MRKSSLWSRQEQRGRGARGGVQAVIPGRTGHSLPPLPSGQPSRAVLRESNQRGINCEHTDFAASRVNQLQGSANLLKYKLILVSRY